MTLLSRLRSSIQTGRLEPARSGSKPDFMSPELERLERQWLLPSDATPLQRALAYRPFCAPAAIHRHKVIADLCRELDIPPPWQTK